MTRPSFLTALLFVVLVVPGCAEFRDVLGGDIGLADDDTSPSGDDDDLVDDDDVADDDDDVADDDDDVTDDDDDVTDDDDDVADDDDDMADDDDDVADDDDDVADDDDDDTGDDDTEFPSCHPWDPIDLTGAEWVYESSYQFLVQGAPQGDSGTETVQTGGITTFDGNIVFERVGEFLGTQFQVNWAGYDTCEVDGNHDHGSMATDTGGQLAVNTVNASSVLYLPAEPDMNVGATWSSTYTQDVDVNGQAGSYQATWDWEVVGVVSVTVAAGTFDAVHVHGEYDSEDQLGLHLGTLDTYWVEGLGLVRWDEQRPSEGGQYILRELQSFSGPLAPQ